MESSKVYSYQEAMETCLNYFKGADLPAEVFLKKYAMVDIEGNILENSPEMMHKRLAKEFARIESKYPNSMTEDEIFELIREFKYIIPQGSPMSAIGNPHHIQSSGNCFTIKSPYDSYGGIMYSDQQLVQLMKRRCGVGMALNTLRPFGRNVNNAARTTDGVVSFMSRFSNTCREVAQQNRRGALILLLNVHHPDIKAFMNIKRDKTKVTGANISIQATDEFLKAVENGGEFELRYPVEGTPVISQIVSAKDIWDMFIDSAWESAEPGILFWDNVIKNSVSHKYGVIDNSFYDVACNPCAEIVMGTDSCRLLALNTYSFVENKFTPEAYFNYEMFSIYAKKAQRLMDDMVDIEIELIERILNKIKSDPEPDNIKAVERETWEMLLDVCKKGRRTGLGITGIADTLAAINIQYGSQESIEVTEKIYKQLCLSAYEETCVLAGERGSFPIFNYDIEKDIAFIQKIMNESENIKDIYHKYGRRNIALTTTPPAGSISILAQVSSGIEPVFRVEYMRRKKINSNEKNVKVDFVDAVGDSWQHFDMYHKAYKDWMKISGNTKYEDSPYYKATANDIDWISSVDIQAAAQKWICHAISKTCNLPETATRELVSEVYMRAWKKGCKGFTVYRDKCRSGVLVDNSKKSDKIYNIQKTHSPKRPNILPADIYHTVSKGEMYFVIVGVLGDDPYEVFAGKNGQIKKSVKNGMVQKNSRGRYSLLAENGDVIQEDISQHIDEDQEAITRLISSNLRHGCDVSFVVHQLEKVKGDLLSYSKAISRVLKRYIPDDSRVHGETCKECGAELVRVEGCIQCKSCGWSKC